jgi:D-lyxose ketol-isomerase
MTWIRVWLLDTAKLYKVFGKQTSILNTILNKNETFNLKQGHQCFADKLNQQKKGQGQPIHEQKCNRYGIINMAKKETNWLKEQVDFIINAV